MPAQQANVAEVDPAEKARTVKRDLIEAMIERVAHRYRVAGEHGSFAAYLESQTPRGPRMERDGRGHLYALVRSVPEEEREQAYEKLKARVDTLFLSGGVEAVAHMVAELAEVQERGGSSAEDGRWLRGEYHANGYPLPDTCGYDPDGAFMEVHVENLFEVEGDAHGLERIKKELGEVARDIVTQHPDTQAVVGTSWLLDTRLARRLGFQVVELCRGTRESFAYQGQIIRADGTLDPDLLQKYRNDEPLPHPVRRGHMPVKEFLERYLPDSVCVAATP